MMPTWHSNLYYAIDVSGWAAGTSDENPKSGKSYRWVISAGNRIIKIVVALLSFVLHYFFEMSRSARDPALSQLAVELKTTKFSDAPDLEDLVHERFVELARSQGEYPFRLVYRMPDFKTWVIRLYLGGAVRVIGYSARLCDACRYADMAALRFWKYRVRGASEPVDANLNFDLAQATHDSVEETDAIWLLDRIENYLQSSGILGDPKLAEIDRQKNRKARDARRTVRSDFHALIGQLRDKLEVLDERLKHIEDVICNPEWVTASNEAPQLPVVIGDPPARPMGSGVATIENLFDNRPKP